jgi:exopolyphosphatase/pppGpp-phosphohydrolase
MNHAEARNEFLAVMRQWEEEPPHVLHVARLTMQLYEGLASLHGLGADEGLMLEAAAHLHDTGWATADRGKEHHKESAKIIRRHPWQHFTPRQVQVMAQVARYHRKALPSMEHEDFAALEPGDRTLVEKLASMLRIGDALDRSHDQRVVRVTPQILADRIMLKLEATAPLERELATGLKKADLARAVFQREILYQVLEEPRPEGVASN